MMAHTYMENNYRKRRRKIMIRNDEYSGWRLIADRWRASADIKRERGIHRRHVFGAGWCCRESCNDNLKVTVTLLYLGGE